MLSKVASRTRLLFSIPGVHDLNKVKIKQTNRNYLIHNYFTKCNQYIQK